MKNWNAILYLKIPLQMIAQLAWPITQYRKRSVFLKFSSKSTCWVESGTFKGTTTHFLSNHNLWVHSMEPSPHYFDLARKKLIGQTNVLVHFGPSKDILKNILITIDKNRELAQGPIISNIVFFLDGHFSGGLTYKDPGSPIKSELAIIDDHYRPNFKNLTILIDDARLFKKSAPGYPSLNFIKEWAFKRGFSVVEVKDLIILKQ